MKERFLPELMFPLLVIFIGTTLPLALFNGQNANELFGIFTYASMLFVGALFLRYLMLKEKYKKDINKTERKLIYNLDDKCVFLIDYENTNCLPKTATKDSEDNVYYIFVNKTQTKKIKDELRLKEGLKNIEIIYVDKTSKNLLDIGIGMYVGSIYSLYNPRVINVFSKDRGYESLVQIAEDMGYHNLYVISPTNDNPLSDQEVRKIYKNIKKYVKTTISLGEFKKKIRKSSLYITADAVNYAVEYMEKNDMIEINNTGSHKTVKLK